MIGGRRQHAVASGDAGITQVAGDQYVNHHHYAEGSGPPAGPLLVGVIPLAADCFQGRDALTRLEEVLTGDESGGRSSAVLSGMGGVGKTQLAAAYAHRTLAQGTPVVVWVTATTGQAVANAYAQAAATLCVGGLSGDDPEADARLFLSWTETTDRDWLVVLDDIQDPADVAEWWPPTDRAGQVVGTTRRRDAALSGRGRHLVQVGAFTAGEARSYLADRLTAHGLAGSDEDQDGLAADLGWLPLALAQASAYLIDAGDSIPAYRALLADQSRTLAHLAPQALPDAHQKIVSKTWRLSLKRADRLRPKGMARPLLEFLSVLDPNGILQSRAISAPVMTHLGTDDPRRLTATLRLLHRFNLITHQPEATHREIRIHQLVQRATREHAALTTVAAVAADALAEKWGPGLEPDDLGQILRANTAILHAITGTALIAPGTGAHPVLRCAADSLGESGQVKAAFTAYTSLHALCHTHLGPDHPDTLNTRRSLARWQAEAGDPAGAAAAMECLLDDYLRVLGPDHTDTLVARDNRASWQGQAGDPAGAAAALESVEADYRRVLGPDNHLTLTARSQVALWQGVAGDPAGAAASMEDLLVDYLRVLGPDGPGTLYVRSQVAYWRGQTGDPAGAAAALEDLLTDYLRVFGPDNPLTLHVRSNLASYKGEVGDAASAAVAFEELLDDCMRVLGPDHPHTLTLRSELASWRERAL